MAYEVITLNLIPSGEVPVIHAAQYDVDRPLRFALKLGTDDFDPTGYDLELQIRKVDNNIVTAAPASVSGNVVTFNSTEQMTACSGTNLGEIQITKDDLDIATLHFYLVVQRDVLAGGVTSETAIHNLTSQISEIVPQVISNDYYDKDEVDALIAEHTFDPTNYYDKSEVDEKIAEHTFDPTNYYDKSATDALLDQKADVSDLPDMTNYYDKSATDALLNDKADVSDLPDMTNYYDKSETDTLLSNKANKTVVDAIKLLSTVKSASGSIATFDTDIIDTLVSCGFNNSATKLVNVSGNITDLATYIKGIYQGKYGFVDLGSLTWGTGTDSVHTVFYSTFSGLKYVSDSVVVNAICHQYSAITKTAWSGSDINTDMVFRSDNTNPILYFRNLSYTDATAFKNAMSGVYLIYELATPTTPTITQAQLTAICTSFGVSGVVIDLPTTEYSNTYNGYNNVFTDNGDVSVKYLETIGNAIS